MKVTFKPGYAHGKSPYGENPQSNPLRWTILHKEGEKEFVAQSWQFKCKDFFNDLVAKYLGFNLTVYCFNAGEVKLNDEGTYVFLDNITEQFEGNIDFINKYAAQWEKPPVEVIHKEKDTRIILIPRVYFENTFYISLVTYLIRISNITKQLTTLNGHPTQATDSPFNSYYNAVIKHGYGKLPVESWFFYNKEFDYTNKAKVEAAYYNVHNCGCGTWWTMLTAHGMLKGS